MVAISPLLFDAISACRCLTFRPSFSNENNAVTCDRRVWVFEAVFCCDICDSHKSILVTALFFLGFLAGCDICDLCDICDKRGLSQTPFLSNDFNAVTRMRFSPPKGGHGWRCCAPQPPSGKPLGRNVALPPVARGAGHRGKWEIALGVKQQMGDSAEQMGNGPEAG